MNYYISDLHFGHKNILKFDNRPYFTLTEMKEDIIKRWNERVKKNDNVYILGDVFWYNDEAVEILEQLKGNLFLLKGNHDRLNSEMEKYFVWVKDIAVIKDSLANGEEYHVVFLIFPLLIGKDKTIIRPISIYMDISMMEEIHARLSNTAECGNRQLASPLWQ